MRTVTNSENHPFQAEPETESSVPQVKPRAFGVAASPFNGIKIELGFAILFGTVLWLAADSITASEGTQWLILLVYALSSTTWLVLRTRAVLRRCMINGEIKNETHE